MTASETPKTPKPIKRDKALQPLSREHHHALLLCWKIRAGLKNGIELQRIKNYCDSFFTHQLLPHFEVEEAHLFPILGKENDLVIEAIKQHRKLELLFNTAPVSAETLTHIADLLDDHIRFEERVLFNKIQSSASKEQLEKMEEVHPEQTPVCEVIEKWEDHFWE